MLEATTLPSADINGLVVIGTTMGAGGTKGVVTEGAGTSPPCSVPCRHAFLSEDTPPDWRTAKGKGRDTL